MGTKARWDSGRLTYYDGTSLEVLSKPAPVVLYEDFLGVDTTDLVAKSTGFKGTAPGTADTVTIANVAGKTGICKMLSGTADNDAVCLSTECNFTGAMSPSFEARFTVDSAAAVAVLMGFSDVACVSNATALSLATATWTTVSTDAACFVYDTDATVKTYHCMAVKTDTDATPAVSALLPVAATYATLRVDLIDDGSQTDAYYYIDGVYQGKVADALSRTAVITPFIQIGTRTGSAAKYALVDYVKVWSNRA